MAQLSITFFGIITNFITLTAGRDPEITMFKNKYQHCSSGNFHTSTCAIHRNTNYTEVEMLTWLHNCPASTVESVVFRRMADTTAATAYKMYSKVVENIERL